MTRTKDGIPLGTCAYRPYEQALNFRYVKPVSDVWSMGAIFYFVLTGHYPRRHQGGPNTLAAVLEGNIIPFRRCDPSIPHAVTEVIDRALAKYERDRYQHAGELREAFARALEEARRKQWSHP
jgi:eukaryotic-like serine/threonine-protein kinase